MPRLVEYADELVTSVGPRPGASEGEHQAAEQIAVNFESLGLDTWIQEFSCARGGGWARALYYLLGAIAAELLFILPAFAPLAFILALATLALLALDLMGKSPLHNLISRGLSQNVVARYSPNGADPRRKVVVVAHYDSGRSLLQCAPAVAPFYLNLRNGLRICIVVLAVVALLSLLPLPDMLILFLSIVGLVIGVILFIAVIVELVNLFMPYSQGANCNASGVAALMGVAEILAGVRSDAGLDTGGQPLGEPGRESGAGARRSGGQRTSKARDGRESYDGQDERRAARAGNARAGGVLAGVGGVAGSQFSRAKGLFGGRSGHASDDDSHVLYDNGDEAYAIPPRQRQLRSGKPVEREARSADGSFGATRSEAGSTGGFDRPQAQGDADADVSTADLGVKTTAAARAAAQQASNKGEAYDEESARAAGGGALGYGDPSAARMPAQPSLGVRTTDNPAIRTRPPLTEQQERERAAQIAAEKHAARESSDAKEAMPAWFVNAKKAAKKDVAKHEVREKGPAVARSRYADVPLEYKPEPKPGSKPEPAAAARTVAAAPAQAAAPSQTAAAAAPAQVSAQAAAAAPAKATAAPTQAATPAKASPAAAPTQAAAASTQASTAKPAKAAAAPAAASAQPAAAAPAAKAAAAPSAASAQPAAATSAKASVQPSTLNADFSGIDRLTIDPLPTPAPNTRDSFSGSATNTRLPQSASTLERATAATVPDIPKNERLRSLPMTSLGNSGMIPTRQAALGQQTLFNVEGESTGTGKVSNTGSFAPLGATGVMKPVGEELLEYHEGDERDIYIDDVDESSTGSSRSNARAGGYAPNMMEIPQSRTRSFFGSLGDRLSGGRKTEQLNSSPASWLGVDEDYDARTEGSQIGGWENFSEEDDADWKGGAYGGSSYEEDAAALARFSSTLIDKEVWVVAVGSHENRNAGIKNLLAEYNRELKSALFINLDGVGAGELCYTTAEGSFRPRATDHRLQGLIKSAADALGIDIAPARFTGYNTDAAEALSLGSRAISLMGLDGALPAGWRWSDDQPDIIDESALEAVTDVVVEVIKAV
jgi:hypothetical protein